MTLPIALTLLIAVVAIAAFVSGRFRLETVAVGLLLALLFLFVTVEMPDTRAQPGMVFAGFANTGLITLMALLIVARGLNRNRGAQPDRRPDQPGWPAIAGAWCSSSSC